MSTPAVYSLSCVIDADGKELALAAWYGLGMLGCQETERAGGAIELTCYFSDETALRVARQEVELRNPLSPVTISAVPNQDWNARWRASMAPARVTEAIWASPRWLPPPMNPGDHWIVVEPKMAFGTGHHETTRLAARGLAALGIALRGAQVLDIGVGSGILCFVAGLRGAARCTGIDTDPVCAPNLAENRRENATGAVAFVIGSLDSMKHRAIFDVVVMNMILTHSSPLLGSIRRILRPGGALVWSGILAEEKDTAAALARAEGFAVLSEETEQEWWCGVLSETTG